MARKIWDRFAEMAYFHIFGLAKLCIVTGGGAIGH